MSHVLCKEFFLSSYALHFLCIVLGHCHEYLYDQAEWNLIASVAELAIGFIVWTLVDLRCTS